MGYQVNLFNPLDFSNNYYVYVTLLCSKSLPVDREEISTLEDGRAGEVSTPLKEEKGWKSLTRLESKLKYTHSTVQSNIRVYPVHSHWYSSSTVLSLTSKSFHYNVTSYYNLVNLLIINYYLRDFSNNKWYELLFFCYFQRTYGDIVFLLQLLISLIKPASFCSKPLFLHLLL